jgi:hypothetical protein
MNIEHFKIYGIDNFIIDDDFRKLMQGSNWKKALEELILNFPEKEYEMRFAAKIIEVLHVKSYTQSLQRVDTLWEEIENKTQ